MDELVEKMKAEWERVDAYADEAAAWNAAAKVLLEAALGEPDDVELNECVVRDAYGGHDGCVKKAFANRKARLLAPKTIESRVTVDDAGRVFIDGEIVATAVNVPIACMIMNGLIAEMKEKG